MYKKFFDLFSQDKYISGRISSRNIDEKLLYCKSRLEDVFLSFPSPPLLSLALSARVCLPFARSCAIYEANRFTLFANHG